jgi:protein SCO1/2
MGGTGVTRKGFLVAAISLLLTITFAWEAGAAEERYQKSTEKYVMPDVVLVNQNGVKIPFKKFLESDKPVVLDFIYGTCTTICPVLSVGFVNLQRKLGPEAGNVRFVSISIDPENDTPHVMKEYLTRYRAKPGWDFLTGTRRDIDKVMLAFSAYVPDKMSHMPLTFIHAPKRDQWVRLYGVLSSKDLLKEYELATGK